MAVQSSSDLGLHVNREKDHRRKEMNKLTLHTVAGVKDGHPSRSMNVSGPTQMALPVRCSYRYGYL